MNTSIPSDISNLIQSMLTVVVMAFVASMASAQSMIDAAMFQAPKQSVYTLDAGDTLGVFVEGVVGEVNSMPPVQQPLPASNLGPAMGYPTLVLHDGTVRLPLVDPISVRGLTVAQVESLLKRTFRQGSKPIITDHSRVIVSLIRKRTVNVVVIRGDQSQARSDPRLTRPNGTRPVSTRSDGSGRIYDLHLPAGDSDLLNAMMKSGGLPGVNAEEQINVLRSGHETQYGQTERHGTSHFPRTGDSLSNRSHVQSFPVRSEATFPVMPFSRSEAQLGDGDVVSIAAKPTEVFYTGGLLGGGEFPVPRDRPLSILDAIAVAGGIPQAQRGIGAIPLQQPGLLTLLRRHGDQQYSMQFDLANGSSQRASQTRIRSGDYLILDYSPAQRMQNFGVGVFNTYGIRQLFRN